MKMPYSRNSLRDTLVGETVVKEPEPSTEIGKALSPAEVRKALALDDSVKFGQQTRLYWGITVVVTVLAFLVAFFAIWSDSAPGRMALTSILLFIVAVVMGFVADDTSTKKKKAVKTYLGYDPDDDDRDVYGRRRY